MTQNFVKFGLLFGFACLVFVANAQSDESNANAEAEKKECEEGLFSCADGSGCTNSNYRCDGDKDCADGSDDSEELCKDGCLGLENRFQCGDGTCIRGGQVCNGSPQCPDGSDEDEKLCSNCNGDENSFKCAGSTRCIPKDYACDSDLDCGESDPSDEDPKICDDNCGGTEGKFQCANKKCIYARGACNGQDQCGDGSDESDATCANCNGDNDRTKCSATNKCFSNERDRCDSWKDCAIRNEQGDIVTEDDTDEDNCPAVEENTILPISEDEGPIINTPIIDDAPSNPEEE